MMTVGQHIGRTILRTWGRWGKVPGWYCQTFERWGPRLAGALPLPGVLPNGLSIRCDLQDHVQRQIYFVGAYEAVEAYLFTQLIQPGMTIVDAGANVGQYTLLASSGVGAQGMVHSFEPVPTTFARLLTAVSDNGLTNVRTNRAALWNKESILKLGLPVEEKGNAGAFSVGYANITGTPQAEASAFCFDDYALDQKIGRVDLVKMDIEGAEWFAAQGMRTTLERDHPWLLIEVNRAAARRLAYESDRLFSYLAGELGYRAWWIRDSAVSCQPLASLEGIEQGNVLFHHRELPESVRSGWDLRSVLRWARSGWGSARNVRKHSTTPSRSNKIA